MTKHAVCAQDWYVVNDKSILNTNCHYLRLTVQLECGRCVSFQCVVRTEECDNTNCEKKSSILIFCFQFVLVIVFTQVWVTKHFVSAH